MQPWQGLIGNDTFLDKALNNEYLMDSPIMTFTLFAGLLNYNNLGKYS